MKRNSKKAKMQNKKEKEEKLRKRFAGNIVLEDWFIKSPPKDKIKNEKSWKRRYFLLLKLDDTYFLNEANVITKRSAGKKGSKKKNELSQFCLVYWENESERRKGAKPIRKYESQDILLDLFRCTLFFISNAYISLTCLTLNKIFKYF